MNIKRLVSILIGVTLIAFGVGFLSLRLAGSYSINANRDKNYSVNINKSWANNSNGKYKEIDEKEFISLDGIKEIDVDVDMASIKIVTEDREDLSLHYYGTISNHIRTDLSKKVFGNKLVLEAIAQINTNKNLNKSMKADLYLDIIIPSSYANKLNLKTDLGSANIEGLKLDKMYAYGELGDVNVKNSTFKELDIKASLGEINIDNVVAAKNKLNADLGSIKINNLKGSLDAKTNLGSIDIKYDKLDWDIKAESSSGSIKIVLPKNSNFTIEANTNLGSIESSMPLDIKEKTNTRLSGKSGNGKNSITLIVDLGSINIEGK